MSEGKRKCHWLFGHNWGKWHPVTYTVEYPDKSEGKLYCQRRECIDCGKIQEERI